MKRLLLTTCAALTLHASVASAAGFIVNDQSARATGRVVAVAATATDGDAIAYNPAGVGFADGLKLQIGANAITPMAEFSDHTNTIPNFDRVKSTTGTAFTPNFYATYAILKWLRAGIGINTPFGLRVRWPASSPERDIVRYQALQTVYISPVVAFNLSQWVPGLAIGGGVDIAPGAVELKRDIPLGSENGTAHLKARGFGVGGRVGIMYHPEFWGKRLSFGLSYRSAVKMKFNGKADFDAPTPALRSLIGANGQTYADGKGSTTVEMPQSALFGVAVRPIKGLELEFNLNWINWSSYDNLRLKVPVVGGGTATIDSPKKWKDTLVIRVGAEYAFADIPLNLRVGYAYDPTPVPDSRLDAILPDYKRHLAAIGASYAPIKNLYIDAALEWILPGKNSTVTAVAPARNGTFAVQAVVASLGLRWHFDKVGYVTPIPVDNVPPQPERPVDVPADEPVGEVSTGT